MLKKSPASPKNWDLSCGKCHFYEVKRVKSSLMYTNIGMIKKIQTSWEGDIKKLYSVSKGDLLFNEYGKPLNINYIGELDNLGANLYRKFCFKCHIGYQEEKQRISGCGVCHFYYDKTKGYSHKLVKIPSQDVCLLCHNRSGRIGLSYIGVYETNNLVPTDSSGPKYPLSGGRSLIHIKKDIHFEKGMECVDCHTSRDIMGDAYTYTDKMDQVEISCEDCHGSYTQYPKTKQVIGDGRSPIIESKNYKIKITQGMNMVLTKKGRMYSNVFLKDNKVYVQSKRTGKLFESPIITNTKYHNIYGHKRLKCIVCHSKVVPQCFGCHTYYYKDILGYDGIRQEISYGRFLEKEDFRRAYPFYLGVDKNNKVTTLTPGCQTFIYVRDDNKWTKKGYVAKYKGRRRLRFAPLFSHNIRREAISCIDCHLSFEMLGFGKGVFLQNGEFESFYLCNLKYPLEGILKKKNGILTTQQAVTSGARAFNREEIIKILKVNQCLICHGKDDEIYKKPLDYNRLPICLKSYQRLHKDSSQNR